eukprot:scaffold3821_cov173-Amphora_coffeaeformis.AAC.12
MSSSHRQTRAFRWYDEALRRFCWDREVVVPDEIPQHVLTFSVLLKHTITSPSHSGAGLVALAILGMTPAYVIT